MFKSGFVAILGRPNSGKSTLMNNLVGSKVAIVSPKPQTTRNKIIGILTEENYQIVFVDTPGIFAPKNSLDKFMMKNVESATQEVDSTLILIDSTKGILNADIKIIERYKKSPNLMILLTKVDIADKEKVGKQILQLSQYDFVKEIIPISTHKNINIETLKNLLVENLSEGYQYYEEDMITDKTERFMVSEIIREKALLFYQAEIPHGINVSINKMKFDEKTDKYEIDAEIICEKESHKSIIIGKHGEALKRVSSSARIAIERFLDKKVYLTIWVKIKENWRDNSFILNEIGYNPKEIE